MDHRVCTNHLLVDFHWWADMNVISILFSYLFRFLVSKFKQTPTKTIQEPKKQLLQEKKDTQDFVRQIRSQLEPTDREIERELQKLESEIEQEMIPPEKTLPIQKVGDFIPKQNNLLMANYFGLKK